MSWSFSWKGPASDFDPGVLKVDGKPGPLATVCTAAAYEASQTVASRGTAHIVITAQGWEHPTQPHLGRLALVIDVQGEPSEIQQKLKDLQPVDLLRAQGTTLPVPETPSEVA